VERLLIRINLPSIWREGPVLIDQLEVTGASVTLLAPGEHSPNWDFWPDETEDPAQYSDSKADDELASAFPVLFKSGYINNGDIIYRDLNQNVVISIQQLAIQRPQRGAPINLDLAGIVNDIPVEAKVLITNAQSGVMVDAVGATNQLSLRISGKLLDPLALDGADISIALEGPSLTEIGAMFDLKGLPDLPYEGSAEIYREGTELTLRNGLLNVGQGHMTIESQLPHFPGMDGLELNLEARNFSLSLFGPLIGIDNLPAVPYDIKGNLKSRDEGARIVDLHIEGPNLGLFLNGVVGEAPDYLSSHLVLKLSSTSMASSGLSLGIHDLPDSAFQVTGELSSSDLGWQLRNTVFKSTGLRLDLEADFDDLLDPTSLDAKVNLNSPDLAATLKAYGFDLQGLPAFPISVTGKVSGSPDELKIDTATAESGTSRLSVSGILGDPTRLTSLNLAVDFTTPDILKILPVAYDTPPPKLPVVAGGQISLSPEGIAIENFQGHLGDARMVFEGLLNTQAPHNNSHIALSAEGPDLGKVLKPWLKREIAHVPFELSLDASAQPDGIKVERLEVTAADSSLSARIDFDKLDDWSSAHGDIQFTGSSSLSLARLLSLDTSMPDVGYALNIGIQKSPDWLRLDPIRLDWGKSDLSGNMDIHPGAVPTIQANLHSKIVDLSFLPPDVKVPQEKEAATAQGTVDESVPVDKQPTKKLTERVISNEPLDFGWIKILKADLKYQLDELYISPETSTRANIEISIVDGVLSSRNLSWDGTVSAGNAELTIHTLEDGAKIDIYLDIERIPMGFLIGVEPDDQTDTFYRARIEARGNSIQELAKTSNGAMVFKGSGGRLNRQPLDLLWGDFFKEIVNQLNPFRETALYTQIVCHAGAITIKDGQAAIAPGLILRTDKMDIASDGMIDLHNETLNLAFTTRSREGTGVSAGKAITPYLKIGGTLAKPTLVIDPKGTAVSGSAAFVTGGLSILAEGLWDRWVATAGNPCERLLSEVSKDKNEIYKPLLTSPNQAPAKMN
jgi:hypothetical protein